VAGVKILKSRLFVLSCLKNFRPVSKMRLGNDIVPVQMISTRYDGCNTCFTKRMTMNTLSLLAETSPRVYHDALASGNTVINNLYNRCLADNLTNLRTGDELEQLFAVFDVALDHGLGSVVLQYASQVRRAPSLVLLARRTATEFK
jgi:hypothetical protein